jgi:hypothetical protein
MLEAAERSSHAPFDLGVEPAQVARLEGRADPPGFRSFPFVSQSSRPAGSAVRHLIGVARSTRQRLHPPRLAFLAVPGAFGLLDRL